MIETIIPPETQGGRTRARALAAALTLAILSPVLTEVVTGSTPLPGFFHPGTLAFLVIIGYGLPVVLIREWAVRFRLGAGGIFFVGLAYGIYNEGLWAKTMVWSDHLPIAQFDHYGRFLGINFPWSAAIALWHALGAVLVPIALTHFLFPSVRQTPWLNKYVVAVLSVVLLGLGSLAFLGDNKITGTRDQLAVFLVLMTLCIVIAAQIPKKAIPETQETGAPRASLKPVWLGLSILPVSILVFALAGKKVPVPVFFIVLGLVPTFYSHILRTRGWLVPPNILLFGFGSYMQSAFTPLLIGLSLGQPMLVITAIGLELVFVGCIIMLRN